MTYSSQVYLSMILVTFVVLCAKDPIILALYEHKRPRKSKSSIQTYLGYVAIHWMLTYLILWSAEVVWRSFTGAPDSYYGFIVASMEAMLRFGAFVFSKGSSSVMPNKAELFGSYNYLVVALVAPIMIWALDWMNG